MKTYCQDYLSINHRKKDPSKEIACCLFILIEKYEESINNLSKRNFAHFLINTLNFYLKDKNYKISTENDLFLNSDEISLTLFYKFIDIIIHYSSILLKYNKTEYAKFILSIGLDLINKNKNNSEKKMIKKKVSLANNIACTYTLLNNYYKAELFFNKCEKTSKSLLDKIITYNNYCLVQIKKIKIFYHDTNQNIIYSIINNIVKYLKLMFNEISERVINKYKIELNKNDDEINKNNCIENYNNKENINTSKNEIFCFLIYNYLKITKIFCCEDFNNNYSNLLLFVQKILGNHHLISIKMIRLGNNEHNIEYIKSFFLNDNYEQKKNYTSIELELNDSILSDKRKNTNTEEEIIEEKITIKEPILEIKQETKFEIKEEPKQEKEEPILEIKQEAKLEIKEEPKQEIRQEPKLEIKQETKIEIKEEPKQEIKQETKLEIKQEAKLEIKQEKKVEIKEEIKEEEIKNDEIKQEKNDEITNVIKEEKKEDEKKNANTNIIKDSKDNMNIINEIITEKIYNNSIVNNSEEKRKKGPPTIKKTWKGMFQALTGKKPPNTENRLNNLFRAITESNNSNNNDNNNISFNNNNINLNNNKNEIKSQYNEYNEVMEKYMSEVKTENYITFNKNYSNNYTSEFIISIIDDNDEEKKNFDKIGFEKSQQKQNLKKPVSLFVTSYFKSLFQKKTIHPEMIDDILDYDVLEKMNNLYTNKRKNEFYINKEIDRIAKNNKFRVKRLSIQNLSITKSNSNDNNENILVHFDEDNDYSFDEPNTKQSKIETECYLDSDKYKIYYINDYENNKILINVSKAKFSQTKKDSFDNVNVISFPGLKRQIPYGDLYYYFSKYYKSGNISFWTNLRYIDNFNIFIQRVLVQYIKLIQINKEPQLVFCKYPKGNLQKLNRKGRPEFSFINEMCTFVVSRYKEKIEIIIYNLTYTASLRILFSLDESSESVFFAPNKKGSNISGKVMADFEYNANYKIFSKFSTLFIKIQKVLQFRDKSIKNFTEYCEKYKSDIHKISLCDSIINIDLWIISLHEIESKQEEQSDKEHKNNNFFINNTKNKKLKFEWYVELFTLTKLKIKNGSFYVYKKIVLNSNDFENIIGCDYSDIYTIIDEQDNYFCLYFLLGTIQKMKHLLIKMLNSSNYLTAFKLEKLKPISFFKYKFVFKHIKRYFLCSLEFLVYTREIHFLRIMIMESITNRCYSKIYIPFYSIKKDFDAKETKKILIEKYEVIDNLFKDKNKLKKFLCEESKCLLTKNPSDDINVLILFENIEFLVERIKNFIYY